MLQLFTPLFFLVNEVEDLLCISENDANSPKKGVLYVASDHNKCLDTIDPIRCFIWCLSLYDEYNPLSDP